MTNEFDKEIDSLLRQTARNGEAAFNGKTPSSGNFESSHVDADEISLFAENALSVKARSRMTEHLADCDRCRKILSNLIALNSETQSENVHAREIVSAGAPVPWYKKLFAFPQIAYAMGALVVVFSGVIVLMILQSAGTSLDTSVAQREAVQKSSDDAVSANSNAAVTTSETYAMSNTSTATTGNMNSTSNAPLLAANTSTTAIAKATPSNRANSNASQAAREEKSLGEKPAAEQQMAVTGRNTEPQSLGDLVMAKPAARAKKEDFVRDGPPSSQKTENENRAERDDNLRARQQAESVQAAPPIQNQVTISPNSRNVRRSAPAASAQDRKSASETADGAGAASQKAAETRTAGGKVFRRSDGVWYDAAYKGGQTTNIRRGASQYKKLDAGLRSIADSLDGTIVVVWKSKAYRIQ